MTDVKSELSDFGRFWQLVLVKVVFNLRVEAATHHLRYAWWVLEPIMYMGVFYVIFGIFIAQGTDDFVPFLLCGLVPWLWFAHTVTNSSMSMVQARSLIEQRRIFKSFFPIVVVGQDFVKQCFVFLLLLVFLVSYGIGPTLGWLWLLALVATQILLTTACSLFVAVVTTITRDFRFLVLTILTLGMLGSGVFYSYSDVLLPEHRSLFLANPMANLIASYRNVLLYSEPPLEYSLLVISLASGAAILALHLAIRRLDNDLTRLLIE